MYCTSTQVRLLSDSDFISFEQKGISKFPQPYVDFMKTYFFKNAPAWRNPMQALKNVVIL